MKTNDSQASTRAKKRLGRSQPRLELRQFVVHRDAQRLEGPLGWVPAGTPSRRRNGVVEQLDESGAGIKGPAFPLTHDGRCDTPREPLLPVLRQDPCQVSMRVGVENVCGSHGLRRGHPHVQRCVDRIGEPPIGLIELHRRDAQIEQGGVDPVDAQIADTAKARGISEEDVVNDVILAAQPTKEFVTVEQVAALAVFLCTDAAKSITGATLPMDGGWTAA